MGREVVQLGMAAGSGRRGGGGGGGGHGHDDDLGGRYSMSESERVWNKLNEVAWYELLITDG